MLSPMTRILMPAHIPPRPPVETAILHVRDVVRDEVVAESVTFVHRAPQLSGLWIHGNAHGVANAVRVDPHARTVGIELKNVGAVLLVGSGIGIVDVRA